jgi:hypothetical protein
MRNNDAGSSSSQPMGRGAGLDMTKQKYLKAAMSQPVKWLNANLLRPSAEQKPIHLALIRIAIRRKLIKGA